MDDRLTHSPHGSMNGSHAEVAVLVHEGNGGRGDEAQGQGDGQPHQQDHNTIEPAKLVSPQGGESDYCSCAVDDCTGEYAPNKH